MKFKITVEVELSHVSGKFASKEDMAQIIVDEIEQADPGEISSDDDAEYKVENFSAYWEGD